MDDACRWSRAGALGRIVAARTGLSSTGRRPTGGLRVDNSGRDWDHTPRRAIDPPPKAIQVSDLRSTQIAATNESELPTLAAIDIGSNSVKLTIARRQPDGTIVEIGRRTETVRLGAGVGETGRLAEDRIEATIAALKSFAEESRAMGAARILAVATEATRAAENGPAFLDRVYRETGITVEVIGGVREAELSFRGLATHMDVRGHVVIADIGGGSTELIYAEDGTMQQVRSVPVGSGRLTDRHVVADPPGAAELATCRTRHGRRCFPCSTNCRFRRTPECGLSWWEEQGNSWARWYLTAPRSTHGM